MSITATYVDTDTFTVATDLTSDFMTGRRVRADCGADGFKYGTISGSSYSDPDTTVVLYSTGDDLTANLESVMYGIIGKGTDQSVPVHNHDGSEGSGGSVSGGGSTKEYFDCYDNTGGNAFTNSAEVLNLDTVRINSDSSVFSLDSNVLTINKTGIFMFVYRLVASITGGTRTQFMVYLEENTGSWAEVDGSRSSGYARTSTEFGSAVGFCVRSVTSGTQYRLGIITKDADTATTQADKSGLMVVEIG